MELQHHKIFMRPHIFFISITIKRRISRSVLRLFLWMGNYKFFLGLWFSLYKLHCAILYSAIMHEFLKYYRSLLVLKPHLQPAAPWMCDQWVLTEQHRAESQQSPSRTHMHSSCVRSTFSHLLPAGATLLFVKGKANLRWPDIKNTEICLKEG